MQLVNRAHAIFNVHGIKKEYLTSKIGFERAVRSREWSDVELGKLKAIETQLDAIRESRKVLDAENITLAKTFPGYENLISIKGIGPLSATTLLVTIGDIKRNLQKFQKYTWMRDNFTKYRDYGMSSAPKLGFLRVPY